MVWAGRSSRVNTGMNDRPTSYQLLLQKRELVGGVLQAIQRLAHEHSIDVLANSELAITHIQLPKGKLDPDQAVSVKFLCAGEECTLVGKSGRSQKVKIFGPAMAEPKYGKAIDHRVEPEEEAIPDDPKKDDGSERGRRLLQDENDEPPKIDYAALARSIVEK